MRNRASSAWIRPLLTLWALCVSLSAPVVALAHPDLERGKRLAYELDLDQAVAAFDAAVASGTLSRTELIELLNERALLLHALKREEELKLDLAWLSALAPEHKLDLRAPPELIALWRSIRDQGHGPLRLELATRMLDAVQEVIIEANAELTGTVPEGARTRISLRHKDGVWRTQVGGVMRDRGAPGDGMELHAEALGPGGVVVARLHSETAPLKLTLRSGADHLERTDGAGAGATRSEREGRWGRRHRGWIIGTTLVLVAAAAGVTTYLLLRDKGEDRSDQTSVKPMLTF